jgi:cathepsin C
MICALSTGWVHTSSTPDKKDWGCYHGVKEGGGTSTTHTSSLNLIQLDSHIYAPEDDLVAKVNADPSMKWKAKVYDQFRGKNLGELHSMGGQRAVEHYKAMDSLAAPPMELIQEDEDVSMLPKHFDWRSVNGQNYVNPVMNQGMCGSCYATSSLDAIASRVRIQTKNAVKPHYSIENVLQCSEYSQGCKGGYGYLVGKYVQDFGAKLSSAKDQDKCHSDDPKLRAADYYYIGGYYGGSTANNMMHELHKHGPFVVGFNTNGWSYHYESGVLTDMGREELIQERAGATTGSKKTSFKNPWQPTTHAVVIVGWGESSDKGKYWIVKNSWGAGWGEDGFFRIERGTNAHAIESKPIAVIPEQGQAVKVTDKYLDQLLEESRREIAESRGMSSTDDNDDGVVSLSPM